MPAVNRNPKKKASCAKRNMRWVAKSEEHKGYCRVKKNEVAKKSKSRSRSRKSHSRK